MKMNKVSFFISENEFLLNEITGMEFTSLPVRICLSSTLYHPILVRNLISAYQIRYHIADIILFLYAASIRGSN